MTIFDFDLKFGIVTLIKWVRKLIYNPTLL